jgi:hypothetical protein
MIAVAAAVSSAVGKAAAAALECSMWAAQGA